jgi:hypothetical protein
MMGLTEFSEDVALHETDQDNKSGMLILGSQNIRLFFRHRYHIGEKKFRGLSPLANYTDRAIADCQQR